MNIIKKTDCATARYSDCRCAGETRDVKNCWYAPALSQIPESHIDANMYACNSSLPVANWRTAANPAVDSANGDANFEMPNIEMRNSDAGSPAAIAATLVLFLEDLMNYERNPRSASPPACGMFSCLFPHLSGGATSHARTQSPWE